MRITTYLSAVALLLGNLALSGCAEEARADGATDNVGSAGNAAKKKSDKTADKAEQEINAPKVRPINVKFESVTLSSLTQYIVANGTTQAVRELTYSAEVPGRIEALSVDIGDRVRRGQILARIDYTTLQAQAAQAKTSYDLASSTYNRLSALQDEDIISKQRIDEARSNVDSAEAGLSIAQANVKKARVRSTYSGIVDAKFVEKGEYVGPGTPLFKVVDYKTIIVEAHLAETQVAGIDRDAEVEVEIEALHATFTGKIDTLIPTADRESKTFTLRIKVQNKDYAVLIGMSAVVRLPSRTFDNVIVVPQSAVIEERSEKSVFVEKNGLAERRSVRLGAAQGDKVVVQEGLKEGDHLIVLGQRELEDGKPVRIVE